MKFMVLVVLFFASAVYSSTPAGLAGDGTSTSPYIINSVDDFNIFCDNNSSVDYWAEGVVTRLDCDIDLDGFSCYDRAIINHQEPANYATPGYQGPYYNGIFKGSGHTISNFQIDIYSHGQAYSGLFAYLSASASVSGLNVQSFNYNIYAQADYISVIAAVNDGTISNCTVTADINSSYGGSYNGLITAVNNGTVTKCVANNYFIIDSASYIGGISGSNSGTISYSAAFLNCCGNNCTGAIAGENTGSIFDCYSQSSVYDNTCAGGICGLSYAGSISRCYHSGPVGGNMDAHPIIGINGAPASDCYYDSSFGGTSSFATPLTNTQMFLPEYLPGLDFSSADGSPAIWIAQPDDFPILFWQASSVTVPSLVGLSYTAAVDTLASSSLVVGQIDYIVSHTVPENTVISHNPSADQTLSAGEAVDLLISSGHPYSSGSGTQIDPYIIDSPDDLTDIAYCPEDLDKHFLLNRDISLAALTFDSALIASEPGQIFDGSFDGNNHKISELNISASSAGKIALFASLGTNAAVTDLTLTNCSIDSGTSATCTAILAGENRGLIQNCRCSGSISSICDSAGIVAYNDFDGSIERSSAFVSITYTGNISSSVGGICASNLSTISRSFADINININGLANCGAICDSSGAQGTIEYTNCRGLIATDRFEQTIAGFCVYNTGFIADCYSLVNIISLPETDAFGFFWNNGGTITRSYCDGNYMTAAGQPLPVNFGSINKAPGNVSSCYYPASLHHNNIAQPLDKIEMYNQNSYLGFNFDQTWTMATGTLPLIRDYLPADIDRNGTVNLTDLTQLATQWLSE